MQEYKYKKVGWECLSPGDQVEKWEVPGGSSHYISAEVKSADESQVVLLHWGLQAESIPSEGVTFYVKMSDDEYKKRYLNTASEITRNIQLKIKEADAGPHMYHDTWCNMDPWGLAAHCEKEHLRVIGQFEINNKEDYLGDCDIGICFENMFKERFWCRAKSKDLKRALFLYYNEAPTITLS